MESPQKIHSQFSVPAHVLESLEPKSKISAIGPCVSDSPLFQFLFFSIHISLFQSILHFDDWLFSSVIVCVLVQSNPLAKYRQTAGLIYCWNTLKEKTNYNKEPLEIFFCFFHFLYRVKSLIWMKLYKTQQAMFWAKRKT